ncbi:hypothetical protein ABPG73_005826 [Tetrahymena malaccensis]
MSKKLECQQRYAYPFQDKIYSQQYTLNRDNKSIVIPFQLKSCLNTNRKLLISDLSLDIYFAQDGFVIDQSNIDESSVTFNTYKETFGIDFILTEICIDTFFVEKIKINNIKFDDNGLFQYKITNPPNFNKNMKAFPFIIGATAQTYPSYLFIQEVLTQDDGFLINFKSSQQARITLIIINYIYYDQTNNLYYKILQIVDKKYQEIQNPDVFFNKTSTIQIQDIYQCEKTYCKQYSMVGFTGYKQNQTINLRQFLIMNITQQNEISINYCTWSNSVLYGVQSQFLLFQMAVCQNGLANFRDQCQECPSGFFQQQDIIRNINICVKCDSSCLTCKLSSTKCTSCSQENPYFLIDQNKCEQQYPNQYYCEKDQSSIQYNCTLCINCHQCRSQVECCNNNLFKFNFQNQNCECFDQQTMVYHTNHQKCSCKDENTMVNNIKNCTCKDTSSMKYNPIQQKCECLDLETMVFDNYKCICKDEPKMTFQISQNKCVCNETMQFNSTTFKCDCIDVNNMIYNQQKKKCECPPNMVYNQNIQLCVCQNSSQYFDKIQKACQYNPAQKNCEVLDNFLPKCNKCLSGFQNKNGDCQYCGKGKFFDESTQLCSQECQDYCFLCSNKQNCYQYNDEFPCHFSCQLCSIPNSSQSCILCSTSTRIFNSTDSTCNCRYGYEETNKTDCIQIVQSYSQQFLAFKNIIQYISFYMQLIQALIPLYPHLQYSFMLQQQIGIISKYFQNNTNNLRIEMLQGYQNYNFQFFEDLKLIQSDNRYTQNYINYLMMTIIIFVTLILLKLVCLVFQCMKKKLWIQIFQDQSFIVASRLASINILFTINSILHQLNTNNKQSNELILVSINLIFLTLFILIQINNFLKILRQNQQNQISQQTSQILYDKDIQIQVRQIRIMMYDMSIISRNKYFIWTLCEIRKIFTIILLEQISSKINFFVTGGIQIVFGIFLLFNIFDTQQKQFYCLLTEFCIASIYFLTAVSDNSQDQNIQVGLDYSKPSMLDIISIIVIFLLQIITILNCSYCFCQIVKQILLKKKNNRKNIDQFESFCSLQFPEELNVYTIEEILTTNKKFVGLKKKRINKQL